MVSILSMPLAVLAMAAGIPAQTWALISTASPPSPRSYVQSLCFDRTRLNTVMYGGYSSGALSDTWTYDGSGWTHRQPITDPGPKWGHRTVYDSRSGLVLLWGGRDAANNPSADLWAWNGAAWFQMTINGTTQPAARSRHMMAFDERRGVVVVYGGFQMTDTSTWELDTGTFTWRQVATAQTPQRLADGQMVYDASRGLCVMFGGFNAAALQNVNTTWEYDGRDWRQVATAHSPSARSFHAMSYDMRRDQVVLHGGSNFGALFGETWTYDGSDWTSWATTGMAPVAPAQACMGYDPVRDVHVHFGGSNSSGAIDATYEYRGVAAPSYATAGAGCAGSNGIVRLAAAAGSKPRSGTTFTFEVTGVPSASPAVAATTGFSNLATSGVPLPIDLGLIGMPGCLLDMSPDLAFPAVAVGGRASWSAPIAASLRDFGFWNQVIVLDPGAGNPAQATLSNACRGYIAP